MGNVEGDLGGDALEIAMGGEILEIAMGGELLEIAVGGGILEIAVEGETLEIAIEGEILETDIEDEIFWAFDGGRWGGGVGSELLEGHTTEYEPSLVGLPDRSHRHLSPS